MAFILQLCPALESLSIIDENPTRHLDRADNVFGSLRSLCLELVPHQEPVSDTFSVLNKAPRLEELFIFGDTGMRNYEPSPWKIIQPPLTVTLCYLRKMVVEGITENDLQSLISRCPSCVDLEYYQIGATRTFNPKMLIRALSPIRKSLQRLCFAFIPSIYCQNANWWLSHTDRPFDDTIQSLKQFSQLQELGIDQASLVNCDHDRPKPERDVLFANLPRTLRRLRLMYAYRDPSGHFVKLLSKIPYDDNRLKDIRIGIAEGAEQRVALARDRIPRLFAGPWSQDIQVSFVFDLIKASPRSSGPGDISTLLPCLSL